MWQREGATCLAASSLRLVQYGRETTTNLGLGLRLGLGLGLELVRYG